MNAFWERTQHEQASLIHEDQYDCDGRRFREQKSVFGVTQYTRKHLWDQENVLYETNGSNVLQVAYTLEPALYGNLISQRYAGNSRYYHFDALGSTRQLTNSLAAILSIYDYKAYGEPAAGSALATLDQPYTYVGRLGYYTGIVPGTFVRKRWYQPTIAVWLLTEPEGIEGDIWNLYRYVGNSPSDRCDPSGLDWLDAAANFAAGVGDGLTAGVTSWIRSNSLEWYWGFEEQVDYQGGWYIAGEVTEFAVETTVTLGGAALRKHATKYAGRVGRKLIEGNRAREKWRVAHGLVGAGGAVHHINPLRQGRFPLAFKWAGRGHWNMTWVPSRAAHNLAHRYLKSLDRFDYQPFQGDLD